MEIVCKKFSEDALRVITWETGKSAGRGRAEGYNQMSQLAPGLHSPHPSLRSTGCPRPPALGGVVSLADDNLITFSAVGDNPSNLKVLLVEHQSVHSCESLGQGQTQQSWLHCDHKTPTVGIHDF